MTARPLIIVGFVPVLASAPDFEPDSVILIEDSDVIRERDVAAKLADSPMLRELVGCDYRSVGAADEFYNSRPDLDPILVAPLVEYTTPFAARLAERYGRPDKSALRRVSRAAGIRNPEFEAAISPDDVRAFMAAQPGPVVLKPADRQASLGTIVLHDPAEVEAAWRECTALDEGALARTGETPLRMLVERYVKGDEYSVEMLVRHGVPLFANVTEKMLYPGPRPIELGHVVPARISDELAERLRAGTEAVLRAVAFDSGVVHCEWIVSDGEPYLVECAGRFPGDGIVELIDRAYAFRLAEAYFTVMRGEAPVPPPQAAEFGAAVRFLQVDPGRITAVNGIEAAEAMAGVVHVSVDDPGTTVNSLRSSWDRPGSVLTYASTAGEAIDTAMKAVEQIQVQVTTVSESVSL